MRYFHSRSSHTMWNVDVGYYVEYQFVVNKFWSHSFFTKIKLIFAKVTSLNSYYTMLLCEEINLLGTLIALTLINYHKSTKKYSITEIRMRTLSLFVFTTKGCTRIGSSSNVLIYFGILYILNLFYYWHIIDCV